MKTAAVKDAAARKDRSHQRIQAAAARMVRRDGLRGTSVRKVMAAAGLTAGGFYAHFRSKEALLQEAFSCALREKRRNLDRTLEAQRGAAYAEAFLRAYLTPDHRDSLQDSCPYAALLSELPRAGRGVRARVRQEFLRGVQAFVERLDMDEPSEARHTAILALCLAFGALAMSRTLSGYPEADELLRVASSGRVG
jgi:TetR/AcrR family transcriptional regulator, transcriptional repressor for nem operon